MKKTEKIELRVDHAEKERLSAIAERRGQTVSDVVRDALAGELGVARADYPKWPGWVSIFAIATALGAFLFAVIDKEIASTKPPIMSQLSIYTPDNDVVLETFIPHRDGYLKTYTIRSVSDEFQAKVEVVESLFGTFDTIVIICKQIETNCVSEGRAEITLAQPTEYTRVGLARLYQEEEPMWSIRTIAPKLSKPEKVKASTS